MPVVISRETAESPAHNNNINFPLDKYLAEFLTFPGFSAEFLFLPRLFIPAGLGTASPRALPLPQAQEFRQVHRLLFPTLRCSTDLMLNAFFKGLN